MKLHIKFDQDWPPASEIFTFKCVKDSSLKGSNSKMSGLIRPKIELDRAFMPVLVTSNFDDDSIHLALFSLRTESDNPDATCELSP